MPEGSTVLVSVPVAVVACPVEATPSAHLSLQKVIEEAARHIGAEPGAVEVEVGQPRGGPAGQWVTVRVRGGRSPLPEEDLVASMRSSAQGGDEPVPRHGVKLALAASIARANGWSLRALQERGPPPATVFVIEVPIAGTAETAATAAALPLVAMSRRSRRGESAFPR